MSLDFGVSVTPGDVIELDSSTPSKFSRHLIVDSPSAAFCDNRQAGEFVRELCSGLGTEQRARLCFTKDGR